MEDLIGWQLSDPLTINEMFDEVDTDKSGSIDRSEMKRFVATLMLGHRSKKEE